MFEINKPYRYQVYAERVWTLSTDLMLEAARLGRDGKGYAVVAHEARMFAEYLASLAEKAAQAGSGDVEILTHMARNCGLLSMNLNLETIHVYETDAACVSVSKAGAVLAEEIRILAADLTALLTGTRPDEPEFLEVSNPLTSVMASNNFFRFSIGGRNFVENIAFIKEFCSDVPLDENGTALRLRGMTLPVVDARTQLGIAGYDSPSSERAYFVAETRYCAESRLFAARVDALGYGHYAVINQTRIGTPEPLSPENAALQGYIRDCWNTTDGQQMLFIDWNMLL